MRPSTTTYKVWDDDEDFETKIVITDSEKIEVFQDDELVLTLTKQDDGKVNFEFYDTCEGTWDSGVCHNTFKEIKNTIVCYPFDFQVYSL